MAIRLPTTGRGSVSNGHWKTSKSLQPGKGIMHALHTCIWQFAKLRVVLCVYSSFMVSFAEEPYDGVMQWQCLPLTHKMAAETQYRRSAVREAYIDAWATCMHACKPA